jgi:hypothetical protein
MTKDDSILSSGAGSATGVGARAGQSTRTDDPWADARAMIDGWKGGINIAHEALDRHVEAGHGGQLAIRWLGKSGERRDLSYSDLQGGQPLRAGSRGSRPQPRGQRLRHGRARARALCHGAGHVEGGHDLHTPVLGLRSGACAHPHGDRRRDRPGHDRKHLPPQDRLLGFRDRNAEADPDHRATPRPRAASRSGPRWTRPHRGSRRWRRRRKTPR